MTSTVSEIKNVTFVVKGVSAISYFGIVIVDI